MIKRPLCTAAVLYLCIQTILTAGFHIPSDVKPGGLEMALEQASDEESGRKTKESPKKRTGLNSEVSLIGTVYRREEKPDYNVLYLKDSQVLLNKQIYQESKILVYVETETQVKIRNVEQTETQSKIQNKEQTQDQPFP